MIRLANCRGATLELPVTISWRRVPLAIGVPSVVNARGDGNIIVGRSRIEARQFSLSGSIYYPSRQATRDAADNLLQFLQHPPIEVSRWPVYERRIFAWPQGAPLDWVDAGAELGINVPMLAPDPYWYGAEVTIIEEDAADWEVDVDGNAPALPIVRIEVGDSGSSIELSGPGGVIELGGDYQSGDIVTVDTARFEAVLTRSSDSEPINDRLGDGYIASGFALVPGTNALEYTGPQADVTLTYRPRWY